VTSPIGGGCEGVGPDLALSFHAVRNNDGVMEALMKYVLGLVLGIPIPILAIWFLVSHC
jgi:hypothetical protein